MKRLNSGEGAKLSTSILSKLFSPRAWMVAGTAALLSGCAIIPKGGEPTTTASIPETVATPDPTPLPSPTALPTDAARHRIALLVPTTGQNAAVGQALANATTMALIDTNASNLCITTYDTSNGAASAARQAIADGNRLILGPLLSANVQAVRSAAAPVGVPAIAFSNDTSAASGDVFVMGHIPEQSIDRAVRYARSKGARNFGALLPEGDYGQRSYSALTSAVNQHGGKLASFERYSRSNTSVVSAAQRLRSRGGYDTVLIADGVRLAVPAADELKRGGNTRLLGTELWSGEVAVTRAPSVNGAIFAAVSDSRFRRFSESYEGRFGSKPYRIATLGYDSVLLTLRIAQSWQVGNRFPKVRLYDSGGFLGVDGAFRFSQNGVVQRALEVREVQGNRVVSVDAAPNSFGN